MVLGFQGYQGYFLSFVLPAITGDRRKGRVGTEMDTGRVKQLQQVCQEKRRLQDILGFGQLADGGLVPSLFHGLPPGGRTAKPG